jgi:hypothetical protein
VARPRDSAAAEATPPPVPPPLPPLPSSLDLPPTKVGRKTKLTEELMADFELMLAAPVFVEDVCDALGVDDSTFYRWLERGDKEHRRLADDPEAAADPGEALFREFRDRIRVVQGRTAAKYVTLLASAAEKDWRANVELLKRRWPSRWNRLKVDLGDDKTKPPAESIDDWLKGQGDEEEDK